MTLRLTTIAVLIAVALVPGPISAQVGGLPATVVDYGSALPVEHSYPVFTASGASKGTSRWRVVSGTGNCCENFIGSSAGDRLFDFGSNYIRLSDDLGKSWKEVRSNGTLLGAEGAIAGAPGGDIVGATWDPYTGDRILAFKYEAETETWLYQHAVLHTPFFDRPWFAVVPGPFTIGGIEAPYLTILKGGWPSKDVAYYSLDGLNYFLPTESDSAGFAGENATRWLDVKPDRWLDWIQPNTSTGIAPLGDLGALWHATDQFGLLNGDTRSIMTPPDAEWERFSFPRGEIPPGRFLVDSRGRLHNMSPNFDEGVARSYTYSISSNGGRDWTSMDIDLPKDHVVETWDFKVNGELGTAILGVHAHRNDKDESKEADQDLLFELRIRSDLARVRNIFFVGNGDLNTGGDVTASGERFDFASVAVMPDGTIVTSISDQMHKDPAIAILLER